MGRKDVVRGIKERTMEGETHNGTWIFIHNILIRRKALQFAERKLLHAKVFNSEHQK